MEKMLPRLSTASLDCWMIFFFLLYKRVLKEHLPKSASTRAKHRLNPYVLESGKCTGFLAQVQHFSVCRGKNINSDILHSPGVVMTR